MRITPTVIEALRRFLPEFLKTTPPLSKQQRRALWAITHCRTPALGGRVFGCEPCGRVHFAYHSCHHKACPQCGAAVTRRWVQRESKKRVNAPYFLVTFTLPAELRGEFFGPLAKQAYDTCLPAGRQVFFTAASRALAEKLGNDKGLRAHVNGFTIVLHTWNQPLEFHPHLHCVVPGAGLKARGQPVRVKNAQFLIHWRRLRAAFRAHMRQVFQENDWPVDPSVWTKDWGVHIQPVGAGVSAVKYLGAYVQRTALRDWRLVELTSESVSFTWKDRAHHCLKTQKLSGLEFVSRYLRHVLPRGLRAVCYYGFCHPAAKAKRLRVQFHTGMSVDFGASALPPEAAANACPCCPKCGQSMQWIGSIQPQSCRGPPVALAGDPFPFLAA